MSNQWFQFKKFRIQQDRCAMKVGTDGVLLGAWAELYSGKRILDIGTGTGLISLMMAQRFREADVVGVEIDSEAAFQAMENVKESDFSDRIEILHCSLAKFLEIEEGAFDLVVCNPPFFVDSMKAATSSRSLARHADELDLMHLFAAVSRFLNREGGFALVLPMDQRKEAIIQAEYCKLYLQRVLYVRPVPEKAAKRVCLQFGRERTDTVTKELVIEDAGRHAYSLDYIAMTKDFYLQF